LSHRSKYQQIEIIDNDAYGRILFLDDKLQHTAYDASILNEALFGAAVESKFRRAIGLRGGSGAYGLLDVEA
jgi:spermidine synthase